MIVIFILIPLSILIATVFLVAFIWAVRSGQYEDTCTPSLRMLWEEGGTRNRPALSKPAPQPENHAPTNKDEK
jgi:cbb3-type cytochrome oxidase maturation protein